LGVHDGPISAHGLVAELEAGDRERRHRPKLVARAEPTEPVDRDYPPRSEIDALWSAEVPFGDAECAWAESRGLDAEMVGEWARGLPPDAELPRWASYRGKSWRETGHRMIVPVFDAGGDMRSVRAIRVTAEGDSPKRLPPGGFKAAGLVMACDFALGMLRGTYAPARVLLVEGEPDFLSAATMRLPDTYAKIGIASGSWTADFAARVPRTAKVFLGTHDDAAGEKYAQAIEATLTSQTLLRWRLKAVA